MQRLAKALGVANQLLRARRSHYYNTLASSTRRAKSWASTARATSPMAPGTVLVPPSLQGLGRVPHASAGLGLARMVLVPDPALFSLIPTESIDDLDTAGLAQRLLAMRWPGVSVNPIQRANGQAFYGHAIAKPVGAMPRPCSARSGRHARSKKRLPPAGMLLPRSPAFRPATGHGMPPPIRVGSNAPPAPGPARSAARRRRALTAPGPSPRSASAPLGYRRRYAMPARGPARPGSRPASRSWNTVRPRPSRRPGAPARSISTSCCGRAAHWPTSKPTSSSPTRLPHAPLRARPRHDHRPRLARPTHRFGHKTPGFPLDPPPPHA
jgi:hypothetical protein